MKALSLSAVALLAGCSASGSLDLVSSDSRSEPQLRTAEKIPELMEAFEVSGLAVSVVSGDKVLLSDGFGTTQDGQVYSDSTPCGLYSATKVLSSLAYVGLASDGQLNLDAPLGSYLAGSPAEWEAIPFYRLLNHTSGIPMVVNKDAFQTIAAKPDSTNSDLYQLIRDEPLDYRPGEYSRYRQSGYAIGEMIVQDRLGKSFATIVDEYIVNAAGLTSTVHPATLDDQTAELIVSAGGFETTATDMGSVFLHINSGSILSPQIWKDTLLEDRFRFDDYSLGSVVEERDNVLSLGHSGGGERANIRYAPDEQVGVMICTDDRTNNGLAIYLARMLIAEATSGKMPAMPLQVALKGYPDMTSEQVITEYQRAEANRAKYDFSDAESIFNEIGYEFLSQDRIDDAIDAFAFNVQNYPLSANAHDSLGEALLTSGDMDAALARYRYVLELEPDHQNAAKMIAGILERMEVRPEQD